jgi:hypothetical protein
MEESLNQTIHSRKPSKKIKKKKIKYMNLTIFLLMIHCLYILIKNYIQYEPSDVLNSNHINKIFLCSENIAITIFIIILLCKFNNTLLFLCSLLYILIGIIMIFYFLLDLCFDLSKNEKQHFFFTLVNNSLFFIEGFLLFRCSEIMEKEKRQVNREIYGYKNDEDYIRKTRLFSINLLNNEL